MKASLRLSALLVSLLAAGCGGTRVTSSEGNGTVVVSTQGIESIIFGALEIREHQRLAQDLYDEFARLHVDQAFRAARDTRRQNMDSLGRLLRNRDSFRPGPILPRGQFDDPTLAAEYVRLLEIGRESVAAALRVGALLEERDQVLVRQLGSETAAADVTALYARLERGNRLQMSSFVTRLRTLGERYDSPKTQVVDMQALLESRGEED